MRRALAERYQRLLLDEFQDTDPIQIEIAVLIGSNDPDANQKHWSQIETEPGRLFFVGDPKQSIYRFRRADIAMFMKARDELVGSFNTLAKNFRTGRPIVEWVNATFSKMITQQDDSQPEYQPLIAVRDAPEIGPAVAFVGREHDGRPNADQLRIEEAADVSATIRRVIREGWSVAERQSSTDVRDLAASGLARHRGAVARADVAAVPGTRTRGSGNPLPRRNVLTRLRNARDSRPDAGGARRRRSHRFASGRQRPAHHRLRLR